MPASHSRAEAFGWMPRLLTLTGLFVTVILNAVLAIAWLFFVGYRLYRLDSR